MGRIGNEKQQRQHSGAITLETQAWTRAAPAASWVISKDQAHLLLPKSGPDWTEPDWTEPDWTGPDWTGLTWRQQRPQPHLCVGAAERDRRLRSPLNGAARRPLKR